ncbi:MAG: type I-C CRISPR-associated protein Cas8c/Csd1 [Novosphingobium sp.]
MTILQALAGYYDRMAARGEAEPPGFSREKISFAVIIDGDGHILDIVDLRDHSGKKPQPRLLDVPAAAKRTVAITPFLLWDKTAYSLGVTAAEGKRTGQEHAAFRALHLGLLAATDDPGLLAFRRFVERWSPAQFLPPLSSNDVLDTNIVFRLDGDVGADGKPRFIHERPAAQPLIAARSGQGESGFCLVSGTEGPIARLHSAIGGVEGAQSSGASLVSFNLKAFESYGREQGANAPTGQGAEFRYSSALNRLLDRNRTSHLQLVAASHLDPSRKRSWEVRARHRARLGDATLVFWADARDYGEPAAVAAETLAAAGFDTAALASEADEADDAEFAVLLRDRLEQLVQGRTVKLGEAQVPPGVKLHILGLSPNAARLSVRFWLTQTIGEFARHIAAHAEDCRIEPVPWGRPPSIDWLLTKSVAARQESKNIPPLLAGEVARAVFSGSPYPRTLLSQALVRLRAGDPRDKNGRSAEIGWHAAVIHAVLQRSEQGKGAPVSLDTQETNSAYRLGRLFAVLEEAQERALGRVNATIRDRYFGAASATPASVFPLLLRGVQNHVGKLRKDEPGSATGIEIKLSEVIEGFGTNFPRSLRLEDQGRFAIGYYHQRSARFAKKARADDDQGEEK